jgi:hypothetical protein
VRVGAKRHRGAARLWTPWRIQAGNSGGPVLVREQGGLRVAAVTYAQHAAHGPQGDAAHISATVLRAYIAAVDGAGTDRHESPRPT